MHINVSLAEVDEHYSVEVGVLGGSEAGLESNDEASRRPSGLALTNITTIDMRH